jgi:hypothetical protein
LRPERLGHAHELAAARIEDRRDPAGVLTMADGLPQLEDPTTDWTPAILARPERAPIFERHLACVARGAVGSMRLTEYASGHRRGRATLALPARPAAEAIVRLVDRDPGAVLCSLSLSAGKWRQAADVGSHAVPSAIQVDTSLEVVGRQARASFAGHAQRIAAV